MSSPALALGPYACGIQRPTSKQWLHSRATLVLSGPWRSPRTEIASHLAPVMERSVSGIGAPRKECWKCYSLKDIETLSPLSRSHRTESMLSLDLATGPFVCVANLLMAQSGRNATPPGLVDDYALEWQLIYIYTFYIFIILDYRIYVGS